MTVRTVQIFVVTSDKHNMSNTGQSAPKMMMMIMMMMTAMVILFTIQSVAFWIETLCNFIDGNWRFIWICLQLQDGGEDGGSIFLLNILTVYKIMGCQNPRNHNLNSYLLESPKSCNSIISTITTINQFPLNWTFSNLLPFGHQSSTAAHGLNISLLLIYKFTFPKYDVRNTLNVGLPCSKDSFIFLNWNH
jgi:hypothetical protein